MTVGYGCRTTWGNEVYDRGRSSTGAFYLARLKNVIGRIRIRSESIHQSSSYWSETEPNLNCCKRTWIAPETSNIQSYASYMSGVLEGESSSN